MIKSDALFSECEKYRYSLTRIWDEKKPTYLFIGLNPSVANSIDDDKTMKRIIDFVKRWGGGGLYMANLFSYVATKSYEMWESDEPIGTNNDQSIIELSNKADTIVLCWGSDGHKHPRALEVINLLKDNHTLYCLKKNKDMSPKHPLYTAKDTDLIVY